MKHNFCNIISALKNGYLAKKRSIIHVNTNKNKALLDFIWDEGYIYGYRTEGNSLEIFLKYSNTSRKPSLTNIHAISKPGKRLYYSSKQLWKFKNTNKTLIISTSKGLKSLEGCKKSNLGGELLVGLS